MASPASAAVEGTDGDTRYDLSSILFSPNRDYLIRNNGDQVKVDSFSGKIVGLYFSASWCGPCQHFTPDLVDVYNELLQVNKFEIVFVSNDEDNESFDKYFSKMPWLAIPFSDSETRERLNEVFAVSGIPRLVLLDENGKVLTNKGVGVIREHGVKAYPFTPEKFAELEEIDRARREAQTLESILVSEDCDFVIGKDGVKIPVSDLVGKTILLYFSAHWCHPCRAFLPVLMEAYKKINENGNVLEVVFISSDRDQTSFNEFFSKMPWLALPFGDKRKQSLSRIFKVRGIPMVVAIGPNGKTVSTEARELIMSHGAEAYPFTSERLKEIEASYEKMAESLPEKVKHPVHDHELILTKHQRFICDGCDKEGRFWSYYCEDCDFDLHLKCALDNNTKETKGEDEGKESVGEEKGPEEGLICDEEKCHRG